MTSVGFPASHPMHIHGHNFQVLAEGDGSWDNSTIINASNPQRRDTQLIRPNGYLVVQLELNNPGLWAFHCSFSLAPIYRLLLTVFPGHVAWHISEGMNILLLEYVQTRATNTLAQILTFHFPGKPRPCKRSWRSRTLWPRHVAIGPRGQETISSTRSTLVCNVSLFFVLCIFMLMVNVESFGSIKFFASMIPIRYLSHI